MSPIYLAFLGTMFTFLATALGAATVFFFKKDIPHGMQRAFLGFAAGVMIAASVWSLLVPAMEMAEKSGAPAWLPAAGGFPGAAYSTRMNRRPSVWPQGQ